FMQKEFVGVDFSSTAINYAKKRFPFSNMQFFAKDIASLDELNLGKFDLIISIGTLQSSTLNFKQVFMNLIQNYLNPNGSIIFGFPNCRWYDGELIHGAKTLNYSFSEQSLLIKDIYFCKKYLQQKKFRVSISGKNYVFLSASSIKKAI
ncbi:MAG: methyltransferase domain-containing protein, partial [Arcobacter sp.]|nr:methyltransferase domain-containing protein [Arcobacter sp.]